jgi:hypothetical protein
VPFVAGGPAPDRTLKEVGAAIRGIEFSNFPINEHWRYLGQQVFSRLTPHLGVELAHSGTFMGKLN